MTATDELRRLLDERGVEWAAPDESWNQDSITYWKVGSIKWVAFESENGTLWLNCNSVTDLTPSQAIAATLGAGTIDKAAERIEVLSGFAREYLHRYGYLMNAAGEDVTDEVWAIEQVINEVCGRKVASE